MFRVKSRAGKAPAGVSGQRLQLLKAGKENLSNSTQCAQKMRSGRLAPFLTLEQGDQQVTQGNPKCFLVFVGLGVEMPHTFGSRALLLSHLLSPSRSFWFGLVFVMAVDAFNTR